MLHCLRRVLVVLLITAATATGLYVNAQEPAAPTDAAKEKARAEFKKVRKEEYLKNLDAREKHYGAMEEQMRVLKKACAGDDKEACKKAREQEEALRQQHKEQRKGRREEFKAKTEKYRKQLGDKPTAVERQQMRLKKAQEQAQ